MYLIKSKKKLILQCIKYINCQNSATSCLMEMYLFCSVQKISFVCILVVDILCAMACAKQNYNNNREIILSLFFAHFALWFAERTTLPP